MTWHNEPRPHETQGPLDIVPTIPNVIRRACERFGDDIFMSHGAREVSFAETDRASRELARALVAMGLGKGSRIGIMMPNDPDWVICWLAAARIGALAIGLSTLFQRREIDWALRHNDVDTLLVISEYGSADYQARLEDAIPGLGEQTAGTPFYLPSHPYLRRIVVWNGAPRPWAMSHTDAIACFTAAAPQVDDDLIARMEANVAPADDVLVICTSGTTSEPKAVIHTHGAAIRNTWSFAPYTFFQRNERVYCSLAFFWVGGPLRGIMPALFAGACMCFPKSMSGDDLVEMLVREHVTCTFLGVAQAHAVRTAAAAQGVDLSFVREGLTPFVDHATGEPMTPDERSGGSLGMTETFGTHSSEALDRPVRPGKAGTFGRAMPGVERRVVSLETGEVVPPGQEGELHIRGTNMMRGYLKRERHEVFTADGWFPTGDRVMIDEDGYLFFYGRVTEMIKTAGANVAPREVEAVLHTFPEVREAIVFGMQDDERGEIVAAVVVPKDGEPFDPAALERKVRQEISGYKVPRVIVQMAYEDIPRTDAAGKPKKAQIRKMVEAIGRSAERH